MPLITVILVLVVVGILMYLINRYVPMASNIKQLLNWVVVIILILWLLSVFGLFSYLGVITVPRVK